MMRVQTTGRDPYLMSPAELEVFVEAVEKMLSVGLFSIQSVPAGMI